MAQRLLDTTVVSALMNKEPTAVSRMMTVQERCYLSAVTAGEILYGISRLVVGHKRLRLESQYRRVRTVLPSMLMVDDKVAAAYAEVKHTLRSSGINLPENDYWIAATALANGLVLASHDRHFSLVPGLAVEDWNL